MRRSVVGALERDAVVIDIRIEREHLEPAGVRQGEAAPAGELAETAQRGDGLGSRPQHQVVGVAQDDLGAECFVVGGAEVLDRTAGADRHEARSAIAAACGVGDARTRRAICRIGLEANGMHQVARRSSSIASPKLSMRYPSLIAMSHSPRQRSPMNASIIISNVVRGRWKLVIISSTTFQSYGRLMNSLVRPCDSPSAADSRARTVVVPTATTRRACRHCSSTSGAT